MLRSSKHTISASQIDFSAFVRCCKCDTAFTDEKCAYAVHVCAHLFCADCCFSEENDDYLCPACGAELAEEPFRKRIPEWARLQIIQKYCGKDLTRFNVERPQLVNDPDDITLALENTQIGRSKRLEQLEGEEDSLIMDGSFRADQSLNKPTKKYGETPFHTYCKRGNLKRVTQAIHTYPELDLNVLCHNGYNILLDVLTNTAIDVQIQYSIIDVLCDNGIYPSPVVNNAATPLSHLLEQLTGHDIKTGRSLPVGLTSRKVALYESFIRKLCFEMNDQDNLVPRANGFTDIDYFWLCELDEANQKMESKRDRMINEELENIVNMLKRLDPTSSSEYYKFMLNKNAEFSNFTCTSVINLSEIPKTMPLFNEHTKHYKSCLTMAANTTFFDVEAAHLREIFERSMDRTVEQPIAFLTDDHLTVDEYDYNGIGDNDENSNGSLKSIRPTSLAKSTFAKFTNYLNFCKIYNIPDKLKLFKGYHFYVSTDVRSSDAAAEPAMGRRTRRRSPQDASSSVLSIKQEASQDAHQVTSFTSLLRVLGAEILTSQPMPDDETVQATAIDNHARTQYFCTDQAQVCFYVLSLADHQKNKKLSQFYGPVRIVNKKWLYECIENFKIKSAYI